MTTASPATGDRPGSPSQAAASDDGRRARRARPPTASGDSLIVSSGMQLAALGRGDDGRRRAERLGEALLERAELEEVEQPLDLGLVRADHQVVGDLDRGVAAQHADLEVLAHPRLGLGQRGAQLRRQLVEVGEDAVEPAVGRDQLGGRLLADARDARQVVARVAAQRGVLRVLRRRDAGALEDPGLVVERVVADAAAVVEHLDVRVADELVGVAVAGDDDDVVAAGRRPARRPWR